MSWPRTITVTIGGTDFTGDTLDGVQITNGARDWWEQSIAGTCQVTLFAETPDVAIADQLAVDVEDQNGYPVRLFTGRVAAIDTTVTRAGPFWTVVANGPLSTAGRRTLTSPVTYGLDGDQIAALAVEALSTQWQSASGSWDEQTLTWSQFAVDTSEIDQPGVYALAAITDTPANVLDELVTAADSGQGWLYETPDGTLGYGDSTRRETTPAGDFITLPGSAVVLETLLASRTEGDLVNRAVIIWDAGEEIVNLTTSQGIYGLYERTYQTTLADQSDATAYGLRRVSLDGAPRLNLRSGMRVDLRETSDDELDALLAMRRNYGLIVEGVPTYLLPEGRFRGFIEGYVWTLGPLTANVDLFASDYALSAFGLRWAATGAVAWDDVAATVTWADTEESL